MSKSRVFASAALAAVLVVAGLSATPAFADDPPPLVWSALPGFPVTNDGVTVSWETASSSTSPFGGEQLRDPLPVLRMNIANNSPGPKHFGLGTDLVTQGDVDHLWTPEAWGAFADDLNGIESSFWLTLEAGESLAVDGGDASTWNNPLPAWSGHTLRVFELSDVPTATPEPTARPIATYVVPGRFVGANLATGDTEHVSAIIGREASVDGGGGSPDLFPGLAATVTAAGLTPNEELELWIAPNLDYFFFSLLGGGLPIEAVPVGTGTVDGDGNLTATLALPSTVPFGSYQLVAGVSAERYWPAGSYGDFEVTEPPDPVQDSTGPGDTVATLPVGLTQVTASFPANVGAGVTTATVTATGPVADGFVLTSDPPLYYHLSTTSSFAGTVTVCIQYNPANLPGQIPRLYHFDTGVSQWFDITTTRTLGSVCGQTTSFSPFTLGYPEPFDFSGFFNPVAMTAENIAKPGQAIPVKFSLHGNQGLEVVTSARFVTEGTATSLVGESIETATAGGAGLTYDSRADQYTYVWKTAKTLSLKTGRFELTLSDGTVH
ncbi:MAG: PxKF domain-containing protein, partial [Mycetocola sp.]